MKDLNERIEAKTKEKKNLKRKFFLSFHSNNNATKREIRLETK